MTRAVDVVRRIAPQARPAYLAAFEQGDALLFAHGLTTPARLAHFLAQVLHESGALEIDWENMSYSSQRLIQIFGVGRQSSDVSLLYGSIETNLHEHRILLRNRTEMQVET